MLVNRKSAINVIYFTMCIHIFIKNIIQNNLTSSFDSSRLELFEPQGSVFYGEVTPAFQIFLKVEE